jgi:hypothetical protein
MMMTDERLLSADRLAGIKDYFSRRGQLNGLLVLSLLGHIDALAAENARLRAALEEQNG